MFGSVLNTPLKMVWNDFGHCFSVNLDAFEILQASELYNKRHQGSSHKKAYLYKNIFRLLYVTTKKYMKITVFMWVVRQRSMKITDDFDPIVSLAWVV